MVSILVLAVRVRLKRATSEWPIFLAGLPVALLCLIAYGSIYEVHFQPWDLMEEAPSRSAAAAALRQVADWLGPGVAFLGLLSGWRVARRCHRRSLMFPAVYLVGLLALIAQADLFVERNPWVGRSLQPSDVDHLSPHGLVLLALAVALPLSFITLDRMAGPERLKARCSALALRDRSTSRAGLASTETGVNHGAFTPTGRAGRVAADGDQHPGRSAGRRNGLDPLALAATAGPLLWLATPMASPVFLALVLLAPSLSPRLKIVATVVLVVPLAGGVVVTTGLFRRVDHDAIPGLLLASQAIVWVWVIAAALGPLMTSSRRQR